MGLMKGYVSNRDGVPRTGEQVDGFLTKIEDLDVATTQTDGLMSKTDKTKLNEMEDDEELTLQEIDELLTF
jgi:hypothetical protein